MTAVEAAAALGHFLPKFLPAQVVAAHCNLDPFGDPALHQYVEQVRLSRVPRNTLQGFEGHLALECDRPPN